MIAATNRNLPEMIAQGTFREDLFYRLNVIHLHVPPLRERKDDIPMLAEHFLEPLHAERRLSGARRSRPRRSSALVEYPWPGNVRELENVDRAAGGDRAQRGDRRRGPAGRDPDAARA